MFIGNEQKRTLSMKLLVTKADSDALYDIAFQFFAHAMCML